MLPTTAVRHQPTLDDLILVEQPIEKDVIHRIWLVNPANGDKASFVVYTYTERFTEVMQEVTYARCVTFPHLKNWWLSDSELISNPHDEF